MKVVMDVGAVPRQGWEVALECQVRTPRAIVWSCCLQQGISLLQGSSVGKCNKVWLKEFYHSASGASAQDWIAKPKRADRLLWPGKRGIKILFPTLRTVRESKLGEAVSLSLSC